VKQILDHDNELVCYDLMSMQGNLVSEFTLRRGRVMSVNPATLVVSRISAVAPLITVTVPAWMTVTATVPVAVFVFVRSAISRLVPVLCTLRINLDNYACFPPIRFLPAASFFRG